MNLKQKNIVKTSFVYFILLLLFLTVRIFSAFGFFSFLGSNANYIVPIIIQVGIMFLIPVVLITVLKKQNVKTTFKEFGFKKIGMRAVLISVALGILIFVLNIGFASFFNGLIRFLGFDPRSGSALTEYPVWLLFVNLGLTAVLPGVCEEVAHRGMLLNGYKELGIKKAIILSSMLFGLVHLNIEQFFYATIVGVLIAEMAVVSGNIIPGIIVHFINNALSVLTTFLYVNNLPNINSVLDFVSSGNPVFAMLTIMMALLIAASLVFYLIKMLFKETSYKSFRNLHQEATSKILREAYLKSVDDSRRAISGEKKDEKVKSLINPSEEQQEFINSTFPMTQNVKVEKYGKLLIVASLVLGGVVTVFTFIWGVI